MLVIRRAGVEDREAVREIYASVVGGGAALDEAHLERLIGDGGVLVAEEAGVVVGFGSVEAGAAEQIRWLYVLPAHRGGGVGSLILKRLERAGWEAGLDSIRLHAAPGAVGFYRRNGYREAAPEEEVGHDHDGVEMLKARGLEGAALGEGASPTRRA
jgi:GNAT superfamily N-acetyltransferase